MAFLHCENTIQSTSRTFALRKPITTIGRDPGNDLVLDDPMIRPSHASLVKKGSAHSVSLADKAGELYVNGRRTRSASLGPGDSVLIGAWKLTYNEGSPAAEVAGEGAALPLDALEKLVTLSAALKSQQVAMQIAFVATMLPSLLLSGFIFPISNMPLPLQGLSYIVPARYYVTITRGLFLKGVAWQALVPELAAMTVFAVVLLLAAASRFRRTRR